MNIYSCLPPAVPHIYLHWPVQRVAGDDKPIEQARLLFAHCETLVPLASLMGLFKEEDGTAREMLGLDDKRKHDLLQDLGDVQDLAGHMDQSVRESTFERMHGWVIGAETFCQHGWMGRSYDLRAVSM